ncbi:hypothetical protein AVEN_142401-1 [Araneus ventricosus]|uniref:Uncharacterized protein n=1 Tax=Araneus ventricosus TaxID=182803 RepID=A0A4Y2FIQ8_ARAVE|nr:hypothetical protein AVEN_142401-1 [Araneus ventricosus]
MVFFCVLLLCVLSTAIVNGRTLPKGHRYSFDFMNDKVYDFSDYVTILPYFNKGRSGSRSLKQSLPPNLAMEEASPPCPASNEKKPVTSLDLYYIGDFRFSVPTSTGRKRKVLAECGFLLGLTDFAETPPFDDPLDTPSPPELWFRWHRLRAKCQISTVLEGLKEGKGEAEILVKPLYMLVRVPPTEPSLPEIEMTAVKEVTVRLEGLDVLPSEATKPIISHIEHHMICLLNNDIRDVLKDSMKSGIEKQPSPNLTKLIFDRKT